MDFKDFNEIDFLTIKTDFILEMSSGAENINDVIIRIKDMNIDYDTMFVTVLKAVETLRGHITEDIIEKVIIAIKDIYNISNDVSVYIELLKCYNEYNKEEYDLKELYTNDFANNAYVEFNVMFASYYLSVLIDRYGDINEINRINHILKNSIVDYKAKYGRA